MLQKPVCREEGSRARPLLLRSFVSLIVLVALLAACWSRPARADNLDPDQIKAILRTATPDEEKFIDRTVAMVEAGKLPAEHVREHAAMGPQKKPQQVPILQACPDYACGPGRHQDKGVTASEQWAVSRDNA